MKKILKNILISTMSIAAIAGSVQSITNIKSVISTQKHTQNVGNGSLGDSLIPGDALQWNDVIKSINVSFKENTDGSYFIDNTTSIGWPDGANLTEVHYAYSLDGNTWVSDTSSFIFINQPYLYVTVAANDGYAFQTGLVPQIKDKQIPAPQSTAEIIGTTDEWNAVMDSIQVQFKLTSDGSGHYGLYKPVSNPWPVGKDGQYHAHWNYSIDGVNWKTDWMDFMNSIVITDSTKIYLSISSDSNEYMLGTNGPIKPRVYGPYQQPSSFSYSGGYAENRACTLVFAGQDLLTFKKVLDHDIDSNDWAYSGMLVYDFLINQTPNPINNYAKDFWSHGGDFSTYLASISAGTDDDSLDAALQHDNSYSNLPDYSAISSAVNNLIQTYPLGAVDLKFNFYTLYRLLAHNVYTLYFTPEVYGVAVGNPIA